MVQTIFTVNVGKSQAGRKSFSQVRFFVFAYTFRLEHGKHIFPTQIPQAFGHSSSFSPFLYGNFGGFFSLFPWLET